MSMYTTHRSGSMSSHPHFTTPNPIPVLTPEEEPDDVWKDNKRKEIECGFQAMIQEAKDRLERNLQTLTAARESEEWKAQSQPFFNAFYEEKESIRDLARDEFTQELAQERLARRLSRGGQINPQTHESLMQQQAAIMAQIQRDNSQRKDSSASDAVSSSTQASRPALTRNSYSSSSVAQTNVPLTSASASAQASRPTLTQTSYSSSSVPQTNVPLSSASASAQVQRGNSQQRASTASASVSASASAQIQRQRKESTTASPSASAQKAPATRPTYPSNSDLPSASPESPKPPEPRTSVPPANDARFNSFGRTAGSSAIQTAPLDPRVSDAPSLASTSQGRSGSLGRTSSVSSPHTNASAQYTAAPPSQPDLPSSVNANPNVARSGSLGRTSASPIQERRNPNISPPPPGDPHTPASTSNSSQRAPTSPTPVSPPSAFGSSSASLHRATSQIWHQATSVPVHVHAEPPPTPERAPTSRTWNAATATPIYATEQTPPLRAKPSQGSFPAAPRPNIQRKNSFHATSNPDDRPPLRARPSQSNFHPAQSQSQSQPWMHAEMTDEPEELSTEEEEEEEEPRPPAHQVWTPSINPADDPDMQKRERSRSNARLEPMPASMTVPVENADNGRRERPGSNRNARPSASKPTAAPTAAPSMEDSSVGDITKQAAREAALRRESERPWSNLERSRERERTSTASAQAPRPQEPEQDHVSGGATSHAEGSSASARPLDSSAFPQAWPPEGLGMGIPPNPSPLRTSYPSASFVPSGASIKTQPPSVSPPSSFGGYPSEDDAYRRTSYSPEHATRVDGRYSYSSSPHSGIGPSSSYSPESMARPNGRYSYSSSPHSSMEPPSSYSPDSTHQPNGRYSYNYSSASPSSHTGSVPIPVPRRTHTPEEDPPLAYSAGEYSRYGINPPTAPPRFDVESSLNSGSSYSSREESAAAEREREREREREAERERIRLEVLKEAEEEARRKVEEARRKEEEARRKEEAAQQKEAQLRRQEMESERKLREINEREAKLREREFELQQREEETRRKEAERQREEAAKKREEAEKLRKENERQKADAEKQSEQQREFEKRATELRKRAEERKRQESMEAEGNWGGASYTSSWNTPPRASPASPSPSNTSSSARSSATGSSATGTTWSSSSRASSTSTSQTSSSPRAAPNGVPNGMPSWTSSSSTSTAGARPTPSSTSSKAAPRTSTSSQPNPPLGNPEERARRQREQAEEQFRKMQEQLERERQAKEQKAGRMLSKEDVVRIYQLHEQQWSKMSAYVEVTWDLLPWPMYKKPSSAEEITSAAVDAYIMSPHYPDQDKSTKDRVRQQLRRWHEDHFNQKVLSKVSERDKERVKAAAGTVTRNLNNLLERANESRKSAASVFA